MKAYKVEVLIVDFEGAGKDGIIYHLANSKYIHPTVMDIKEADIGEWHDDHLLNKRDSCTEEYHRLFPKQ